MSLPLKPHQYAGPLFLALLCLLLFAAPDTLYQQLIYDRVLVRSHEWWRLLSANLLHTNINHLLLNLAGVALLWALHGDYYRTGGLLLRFMLCALGCTLGLFWFVENMLWYVGLSGALHGLFAWGAVQDIRYGLKSGWLLLAGLIAKLAYEQWFGASADISRWINAAVATDAHLFGALAGFMIVLAEWCSQKMLRSPQ
ncbi:Rhomboid protease [Saliniradius amylolyticus]|uniref:Rhomboid protease n=1 Tax=Saliniradius amylolyticus TaxID=2183582 RepID=A0A2S2E1U2_9ALTE|nr:rhombosortase [Saliniradius amylolyticus]AWL11608.1 Rhomboid protease [Saliniradius amylolyticus]